MRPIAHQSLAVRHLDEATTFWVEILGCQAGRNGPDWVDVWFYGVQVTLHEAPEEVVGDATSLTRHFGVTLERPDFESVVARLNGSPVRWLRPLRTECRGTAQEQTKAMVADPSGNAIEIKTYPDARGALGVPDDLEC